MYDNSQLSDKALIHKLTALMTFSYASRASSLQHLNIKIMARNGISYKFYFNKLHKSQRRGKAPPKISYQAYIQDPNLCDVKTLMMLRIYSSHRRLEVWGGVFSTYTKFC